MRMCILILGALLAGLGAVGGPALAQAPAQPTNAGPVQPWGLPPLPQGIGPVEKFADIGNTPQGKFLEGGAFDDQGNLWFVGIGTGWISYLKPDGTLELDQKPNLSPGRVTVVLRQESQPPPQEDWFQYLQRIRARREAEGYPFMNEEEMNAYIEWMREGDRMDDVLRELDEQRRKTEQP